MAKGRGSACDAVAAAGVVFLCLLTIHGDIATAATYAVGDSSGWTINAASWPDGQGFSAGDVLVFKYDPANHNVVVVDKDGYNGCTPSSTVYQTGNDQITLTKGANYFICSFAGHCEAGMKIVVNAA